MNEMTLTRRDPFQVFDELLGLRDDLNRTFANWGVSIPFARRAVPAMNMWSSPDGVVVDVELPGADVKDLDVSVTGDELTVRGKVNGAPAEGEAIHRRERPTGEFARTVSLPFRVAANELKAVYRNGLLRITVPRPEEEKTRKIEIEAA